jgi:hypothetical protein
MVYRRSMLPVTVAVMLLAAVSGCGSARMLVSTPDGGVVAIPSNSNHWPFHYRQSAEKLMAQKCPNGYIIVREEEVVVGQKTLVSEQQTGPTSTVVTSTRPEKEYRITFQAKPPVRPLPPIVAVPPPMPVQTAPPGLPPRPIPVAAP